MNELNLDAAPVRAKEIFDECFLGHAEFDSDVLQDPVFNCIENFARSELEAFCAGKHTLEQVIENLTAGLVCLQPEVDFFNNVDMTSELRCQSYEPQVEFRYTFIPEGHRRSLADWMAIKSKIYISLVAELLAYQGKSMFDIANYFWELRTSIVQVNMKASCSNLEFHSLIRKCSANISHAASSLKVKPNAVRKRLLIFLNEKRLSQYESKLERLPRDWSEQLYGARRDTRTMPTINAKATEQFEKMFGSKTRAVGPPQKKAKQPTKRRRSEVRVENSS